MTSGALAISDFVHSKASDVYPEPPSEFHENITRQAIEWVAPHVSYKVVLDIGCGQGVALKRFAEMGWRANGVALGQEDVEACQRSGYSAVQGDMHFLDLPKTYGLLWARHVLEHSPIPLYVLNCFKSILTSDGVLYVEVPAPETSCHHEFNPNHYSVFGRGSWEALFAKAEFKVLEGKQWNLTTMAGPDIYWGWILRRA